MPKEKFTTDTAIRFIDSVGIDSKQLKEFDHFLSVITDPKVKNALGHLREIFIMLLKTSNVGDELPRKFKEMSPSELQDVIRHYTRNAASNILSVLILSREV